MLEAIKVALDPSPAQQRLLLSHVGGARFAFNACLAHVKACIEQNVKPPWSFYDLRRWWNANKSLLAVNADTGEVWWPQNSKEAYSSGIEALAKGLSNYFDSKKGVRRGRRVGFPKFKSKNKSVASFAYTTGGFGLIPGDPKALKLPKIGRVHCFENVAARVGEGRVLRMNVSYRQGRWWASLCVERETPSPVNPAKLGPVGVDLGINHLAVLSTGEVIENPRPLKNSLTKLKKAQKSLSRKTKGSTRRERAKIKVNKIHAHVSNQRTDCLHKLTTRLASQHRVVCVEDLNVAGMGRNRHLAQAIYDASFGQFRHQLEYKTQKFNTQLKVVDRFFPSSKQCSGCGAVKTKLSLATRIYRCQDCGLAIDRDLNAAINILVAGSAPETINAHRGDIRPQTGFQSRADSDEMRTKQPAQTGIRLGAGPGNEAIQTKNKLVCNGDRHPSRKRHTRRWNVRFRPGCPEPDAGRTRPRLGQRRDHACNR